VLIDKGEQRDAAAEDGWGPLARKAAVEFVRDVHRGGQVPHLTNDN
jgi:hypothetical protein